MPLLGRNYFRTRKTCTLPRPSLAIGFLLFIYVVFGLTTFLNASNSREVELVWKLSPEDDVAGYKVHYGTVSRYDAAFSKYPYVKSLDDGDYTVDNNTGSFRLGSLDPQLAYWVSITAYDNAGNESDFSNEMMLFPSVLPSCQTMHESSTVSYESFSCWILPLFLPCVWIWLTRHRVKQRT